MQFLGDNMRGGGAPADQLHDPPELRQQGQETGPGPLCGCRRRRGQP